LLFEVRQSTMLGRWQRRSACLMVAGKEREEERERERDRRERKRERGSR
jgi:hypothetical protein